MTEKPPWWQTTKTIRQGLWLGGVFIVVGLGELVPAFLGRVNLLKVIIGSGFLAMGLVHLSSAVAMRRRQR